MVQVILVLQCFVALFFMFTGVRIISGKMSKEFERFGLPPIFNFMTGLIEIMSSIGMIVGIWLPIVAVLSGILLGATMLVASFVLVVVAKDPFPKAIPALVLCLLSVFISINYMM